jgi:hypothetical protein
VINFDLVEIHRAHKLKDANNVSEIARMEVELREFGSEWRGHRSRDALQDVRCIVVEVKASGAR